MMRPALELIYGQDALVARWVLERTPGEGGTWSQDYRAIGVTVDGALACGVVYDRYTGTDMQVSIASDGDRRWASRRVLRGLFSHPFVNARCNRITALVAGKNRRSGEFCLKLGFQVEGRLRNALPDDDYVILGMLREECVWIKEKSHGQELLTAA